ncbi:MAG: cache domain-containing protein [Pseudomonadota bacterium]
MAQLEARFLEQNQAPISNRIRPWAWISLAVVAILTALAFWAASVFFQNSVRESGLSQAQIYQNAIENELGRLAHLPSLLANDPDLIAALRQGEFDAINRKYLALAESSKSEAIYLLDRDGLTLAASNYREPQTFIGQNYSFRPYFKTALAGWEGRFFAIGATTSRPGYFLSAPVRDQGEIIGVVALKLDLTALNSILENASQRVLVSNFDGVVVLSDSSETLYHAIRPISAERRLEMSEERQFGSQPLTELAWQPSGERVYFNGTVNYLFELPISFEAWTLHYLVDVQEALLPSLAVSAIFCAALVLLALVAGLFRENRVRRALDISQRDRSRLEAEIDRRVETQTRLEKAQADLETSSKMAALGQLAASVTHELGQPISALRNHIAAAEMSQSAQPPFLERITGLVSRMENITSQLRFFSVKSLGKKQPVSPEKLVRSALGLLMHDFEEQGIDVTIDTQTKSDFIVDADRMERVFVNFLQNSARAMKDQPNKRIDVTIWDSNGAMHVKFADTGVGLNGQSMDQMREPFHTTAASGEGMGLGLAISDAIIREHGAQIQAFDHDHGASFEVIVPLGADDDR